MDILAHGLWVGVGAAWAYRHRRLDRRTTVLAVGLAVLPDLAQLLPLVYLALVSSDGWAVLLAYANALPGHEPPLSPRVAELTHHLHCVMHSAWVAGGVTAVLWVWLGRFWLPLWGWWSHIVIDVFTHSADFYPSPVFYPLTYWGFDGVAWNTPWFMVANYVSIALVAFIVFWQRRTG
jgi:LexA-binding, inner membrane-associated putative hydrolase